MHTLIATVDSWTAFRAEGRQSDPPPEAEVALAIRALGSLGESARPAVPAIIRAMHANQGSMGDSAGQALGRIGGETAIRELNRIWYSGWDRTLCAACHGALTELGEHAHPALLAVLDGGSPLEQVRALRSLRVSGYSQPDLVARAAARLEVFESPMLESLITFFGTIDAPEAVPSALSALQTIGGGHSPQVTHTGALASEVIWRLSERHAEQAAARPPS